jgi:hypothetical protein
MRRYTSEDVNEVVEGDSAVSLLGLLEVVGQLVLVVLAQRVELPGDDLLKVGTAPPAHLNINYMFPIALLSFLSVLIAITVCTPIQKLTALNPPHGHQPIPLPIAVRLLAFLRVLPATQPIVREDQC